MDLLNLKRGSKFQLTEDFMVETHKWDGTSMRTVYDKGLVLSLVNLTINSQGTFLWFKVLRAKPIIKECYGDINPEVYAGIKRSWGNEGWRDIRLKGGEQITEFVDALVSFDEEYEKLTSIR